MKTRQGFVSNSSSSSFIIYGVVLTNAQKEKLDKKFEEQYPEYEYESPFYDAAHALELTTHSPEYEDNPSICVGLEIVSTYNESIEIIPEVKEEDKIKVKEVLAKLEITEEPKLYICGSRG